MKTVYVYEDHHQYFWVSSKRIVPSCCGYGTLTFLYEKECSDEVFEALEKIGHPNLFGHTIDLSKIVR